MDIVFFVYGLAFILLGVAVFVQPRKYSEYALARFIWLLAAFGLVHGILEWTDLWKIVKGGSPFLRGLQVALLLSSFGLLFEFSRRLLKTALGADNPWRRLLDVPIYAVVFLVIAGGAWVASDPVLGLIVWGRYALGFPAALGAGIGLHYYFKRCVVQVLSEDEMRVVRRYFILGTIAFSAYAILAGLVVPVSDFFPANGLNDQLFLSLTGVPVQIFRAVCAVLAALAVAKILCIFHFEGRNKLLDSLAVIQQISRRNELILQTAAEGIIGIDHGGNVIFTNRAALSLLGYSLANELVGHNLHTLIHHTDRAGQPKSVESCPIHQSLRDRAERRLDDEIFWRKEGTSFPVEFTCAPFHEEGTSLGAVIVFQDITERKRAEQKLTDSELQLQTIIETEPECVKLLAADGTLLQMNRAGLNMIDADTPEQVIGRRMLGIIEPAYRDAFMALTRRVFEGESGNLEFEIRGLKDSHRWLDSHAVPLRDAQGNITALLSVTRDITKRKRAEEALRQLNDTLEQRVAEEAAKNREKDHLLIQQSRLAAMGEMIGNIAHQWRQPINALTLLLANIKDAYEYNELDKEYLDHAVGKGQQMIQGMSSTIDDFRNFFRPGTEKKHFRICEGATKAVNLVAESYKTHNVEIAMEKCGNPCFVSGYPSEFSQVVVNALSNAKDAISTRKIAGKVRVGIEMSGAFAVLTVQDNGGGIPEEILPKVFDPYFTTKEKGTGVGLYMSKMIMEKMGGNITVRNIEDGAEVSITLPLVEEPAADDSMNLKTRLNRRDAEAQSMQGWATCRPTRKNNES